MLAIVSLACFFGTRKTIRVARVGSLKCVAENRSVDHRVRVKHSLLPLSKTPGIPTVCFSQKIRTYLQHPSNRDRYLGDMVWLIHDRFFSMVCSTTTCS
jgi:hypothetical protein